MEYNFNPMEPNLVGPVKVRALASGDSGKGWCSPCPQLHIDIGKNATGATIIGYENISIIKAMCEHALSKGPWDQNNSPFVDQNLCENSYHIWKDLEDDHSVCTKCGIESHQKAGLSPVAIGPHAYEKLKKAGKLEKRKYFVYQSHGEIKAKIIANIIINDLMKHCNEKACKVNELGLLSDDIGWLAGLIYYEVLDRTKVSKVIDHFIKFGGGVKEIIGQLGFWPTYDTGALEEAIDKVITDHPKAVKEILEGKMKALGSLIGRLKQVDKNIDSKEAMTLLKEKIK